ncbi:MAG: hypothetical protein IPK19_13240 [Chloroflexi bacterium]|nr:hypothetical protein [Chloroflexota bacterium]
MTREERDGFVLYSPMTAHARPTVRDVPLRRDAGSTEADKRVRILAASGPPLSASGRRLPPPWPACPPRAWRHLQQLCRSSAGHDGIGRDGQMMDEMPGMYMDMMSAVGPQAYGTRSSTDAR